jgi:hypothetical protein
MTTESPFEKVIVRIVELVKEDPVLRDAVAFLLQSEGELRRAKAEAILAKLQKYGKV